MNTMAIRQAGTHKATGAGRWRRAFALLAVAGAGTLVVPAAAQTLPAVKASLNELKPKDYPARPVELMVAFGAGGGMDVHARLLARYLEKHTGQTFIVANRAGASG